MNNFTLSVTHSYSHNSLSVPYTAFCNFDPSQAYVHSERREGGRRVGEEDEGGGGA